jgi:hypothetical protein
MKKVISLLIIVGVGYVIYNEIKTKKNKKVLVKNQID